MRSKVSVNYYVRKRQTQEGFYPIIMRVSLGGERMTFGQIGIGLPDPSYLLRGEVLESCSNHALYNDVLQKECLRVQLIAEKLQSRGCLSLESIKLEYLKERYPTPAPKMMEVYNEALSEAEERYKQGALARSTWCEFRSTRDVFYSFLRLREGRQNINLSEVTEEFFRRYEDYLLNDYGYHRNTASGILSRFKYVMRYALKQGYIDRNPLSSYKLKQEPSHVRHLDLKTLRRLMLAEFDSPSLQLTKDMFVFSCLTGLSYIDIKNFTRADLQEINGTSYIIKDREKTGVTAIVPLFPTAKSILEKYGKGCGEDAPLLPIYSNQVINKYLKQIAFYLEIEEHLSFHVARHTFATLSLTSGVTLETVSKMLGHSNINTTRIYARVTPDKIKREFEEVKRRYAELLGELVFK